MCMSAWTLFREAEEKVMQLEEISRGNARWCMGKSWRKICESYEKSSSSEFHSDSEWRELSGCLMKEIASSSLSLGLRKIMRWQQLTVGKLLNLMLLSSSNVGVCFNFSIAGNNKVYSFFVQKGAYNEWVTTFLNLLFLFSMILTILLKNQQRDAFPVVVQPEIQTVQRSASGINTWTWRHVFVRKGRFVLYL